MFVEKLRIPISEIFLGEKFLVYLFESPQISHSKIIRACIADFLEGKLSCKKPATVHWNKSDSGDFVAVAVASMPIGIDIEVASDRPFENISRRFFSTSEITSDKKKFYELWTAKEAQIKRDKLTIRGNLDKEVKFYDPQIALDGGFNGLRCSERIATDAKFHLKQNGIVLLEIGFGQINPVKKIFEKKGYKIFLKEKDLQGIIRVVGLKLK